MGEILVRAPEKEDIFLREVRVKVYRRSGTLVLLEALETVSIYKPTVL